MNVRKRLVFLVLALVMLAGCGEKQTVPQESEIEQISQEQETITSGDRVGLTIELEHDVYHPSAERFTYFIHNDSGEMVEFGEPYSIQCLENGVWKELTPKSTVWIAVGYSLQPGGTMALTGSFHGYEEQSKAGSYRLVKEVGETVLFAEFELGESIYTAETPYGFVKMEELPVDYHAASASELDVVFTADGIENIEAVQEFLQKVGMGVDCQLRTVQDYGEGATVVTDVIHEKDHFLRRVMSDGIVEEKRFSYMITDGENIYLSNGADWASSQTYEGDAILPLLIPEGVTLEMLMTVEEQTVARINGNVTRYKIWSDGGSEGIWRASLWDSGAIPEGDTRFSVGWRSSRGGGHGSTYDLQNWDGLETVIRQIKWQGETLILVCDTLDGGSSTLQFDPKEEKLISHNPIIVCK